MLYFIFCLFTFFMVLAFNGPSLWGILLVLAGFLLMLKFVEDLQNEIR